MNPILCPDSIPSFLGFFDLSIAPHILYYTYLPAVIVALFLGFFVWKKDKGSLVSRLFLLISIFFSLWVFNIFILWIGAYNDSIVFGWQITPLFEVPLFIFSIYFTLVMTDKERKDISPSLKLFFIGLMALVFAVLPTYINITSYDLANCEGVPGLLWYFMYGGEILSIVLLIVICIKRFISIPKTDIYKKQILYVGLSIISFLILFSASNIIGEITQIQEISFLGSLGMVVFLGFLVYLIVKFQTFNVKLIATQALVWGIVILIGSQFFFIKVLTNFLLTGITFVAAMVAGNFLIKSVKREVAQREELQVLNVELESLLKQRESLVHLVTHKVKGSFTHTKYIFAGILDGTFGVISPELKDMAEKGLESDNTGIETVDLVLNASNLQKGTVKYDMKPMDFKNLFLKTAKEKEIAATKKGLKLEIQVADEQKAGAYNMLGDAFWLKEVVNNLIDNAIRYSPAGTINVSLEDGEGKIKFSVKDNGIGITDADKKNLFTEGGRGAESVKVNVDSTGYGLYTVKLIVEAHKGRAWAESEGPGKGSVFSIELPSA